MRAFLSDVVAVAYPAWSRHENVNGALWTSCQLPIRDRYVSHRSVMRIRVLVREIASNGQSFSFFLVHIYRRFSLSLDSNSMKVFFVRVPVFEALEFLFESEPAHQLFVDRPSCCGHQRAPHGTGDQSSVG